MANPTTYFGWVMPTSSSLVTNLPADFNTFGQGVDTSMQDLLGGTTGQVLSKTSATNMDFTWVTPTDQTPLTTKGDLFTFTTVDARLAVGANDTMLVGDSSAATGLSYKSAATIYAWTSWTPAYTGLTVGNGTSTGRYQRVGNTVIAQGKLVWGSTTSATVPIYVTLPVANSSSSENVMFDTTCYDSSASTLYVGTIALQNDIAYFYQQGSTGTWTDLTIQDGTRPFTWAVNDFMVYQVTYEV